MEQALKTGCEIAEALEKAHRQGIVHRDLKPGNVMLTKSGAKLLDFGLARITELAGQNVSPAEPSQTLTGVVMGTAPYMSPEQVRGAPLIGATAAYGLALALRNDASDAGLAAAIAHLARQRPTAINLRWALEEAGLPYEVRLLAQEEKSSPEYRALQPFEQVPVLILPCLVRYRDPTPTEGASVYPACQNILLAARALGYGGVITGFHGFVEKELRELIFKLHEKNSNSTLKDEIIFNLKQTIKKVNEDQIKIEE